MENGNLSRKQFSVLTYLEKSENVKTQRMIAEAAGMSLGSANRVMAELVRDGLVDGYRLTEAGYRALEPYRVKRAVFIAAGFGSRLVPITLNTPKPLVRVNGKQMIETQLEAVVAAGIEEIYVVRGYLGEQFDQLLYKYPTIRFVDNPKYNQENNISSVMLVRHLLRNAYVMEADLVLYNPGLITKYQYTSNYLGVPTDVTDDWCFETKNKIITKVRVGGRNCYHMFGLSYWNAADGAKLEEDIKKVYEMPGGKEQFWDMAALEFCKENYRLEVRECTFDDVIEIDSFAELKEIDKSYRI